jgi:2,4-dienoyl-CoA reductase-like NADH-dependent reductase (Old Yellow Enzyme family)
MVSEAFFMLNEPIELAQIKIKNRLVMAPMTTYSGNPDGTVSDQELAYYQRRSYHVGMVITAATAVSDSARAFPHQICAGEARFLPGLKKLATVIKEGGAKAIIQLHHGGRMADKSVHEDPNNIVAPSAVFAERPFTVTPRAMSLEEVQQTQDDFVNAVAQAIEAGFDGAELHGANTYLLQQFFSPQTNLRTDQYGGSLENRMRFITELIERSLAVIKASHKPFILGYRLSPEELETPGITLEDTLTFIETIKQYPLSYIHLSTPHYLATSRRDQTDTVPIVDRIQAVLNHQIPLIGVGHVNEPEDIEAALQSGYELVASGISIIADPDWGDKVIHQRPINTVIRKDAVIPDLMFERLHRWVPFFEEEGRFTIED